MSPDVSILLFLHTPTHMSLRMSLQMSGHMPAHMSMHMSVHVSIAAMTDDPSCLSARCIRVLTLCSCETAVTDKPAVMCARPQLCQPTMPSRIHHPATERAVPTAASFVQSGDDRWMVVMPSSLLLLIWNILHVCVQVVVVEGLHMHCNTNLAQRACAHIW